jgi:hypothetical protein
MGTAPCSVTRALFLASAVLLAVNSFTSLLPRPVSSLINAYGWFALGGSMLAAQLAGAASASGAFEVVDADSGRVLYSRLRSGHIPRVGDVLALLPPPGGTVGGMDAAARGEGAEPGSEKARLMGRLAPLDNPSDDE